MKKLLLSIGVMLSLSAAAQISTFPYSEGFESGPGGWVPDNTANGSWALGTPANSTINTAAGGVNSWITGLATDYLNSDLSYIESPVFDFTGQANPTISFSLWYRTESCCDGANMTYSTDGGTTWQLLGVQGDPNNWYNGNLFTGPAGFGNSWLGTGSGWITASHGVPVAGQADVRFRFNFKSDGSVTENGFAFDNIVVTVPTAVDLEATSVALPTGGCGLGLTTVTTTITEGGSVGLTTGDTIFATYDDGTTLIEDTIILTAPFPSLTTYTHTFSQQADYTAVGTYNVTVTIATTADINTTDNTVTGVVNSIPLVNTFPYFEDFETGQNGWVINNTTNGASNGSWAFGTPAHTIMNSASTGVNAFSTGNLTGNYNSNENSYVISPCFDFTSALGTEQLVIGAWWESENSWDGANVTYSTDGGATWNLLGNNGDPNNWYNDNSINGAPGGSQEGWTGNQFNNGSGEWVKAKHSLPAAVFASSSVRFRVNFGSDGSVQYEGFSFDDFRIDYPPVFDVLPDTISICDTMLGASVDPGVWDAYLWDSGETTRFSEINTTGIHWVEVTGPLGTCARDSFFVDTFYNALPPSLEDLRLICYPDTTILDAGTDSFNTYDYIWSTGATTSSIPVNTAGIYTITKSDVSGNCSYDDTIEIVVAQVDLGPSTVGYCSGAIPTLDAGPGGVTYLWNSGQSTQTITPTSAGAYGVTVIDTNGCLLIDAIEIVESIPVVDLGPNQTICVNQSTTLDAENPGATYLWSNATTSQTITVNGATAGVGTYNYSVTVTDSIGCTATDAITVTVDACAGLEELAGAEMNIFPNPSTGIFNYTISSLEGEIAMTVTDLTGKVVLSDAISTQTGTIDLSSVESGVYFINLTIGDSSTSVRIVKQ